MLFTLLCIALIVLAILCAGFREKFYSLEDFFDIVAFFSALIGIIGIFICIFCIICGHAGVECKIERNQIAYESLCERLEIINSDYEDVSKSDVINDIAEWNKDVYSVKYWSKNPWTSWFYSQEEADALQFIETSK